MKLIKSAAAMLELLEELAAFSSGGPGVSRLLYTREWMEAQLFLVKRMRDLGFKVRTDRVGNAFGRLEGSGSDPRVILTGSHIDTVRAGGKYDGAYGIAAGIAALDYLMRTYGPPVRSIEVVSFCEEEGSRFPLSYWGSGNLAGLYDWRDAEQYTDPEGVSLKVAMETTGFGCNEQPDCSRRDLAVFVELHIEQGITLERMQHQIGIVESIVGQKRFTVTVYGEANHAGTTPMSMRKDPMACAAEMIQTLETQAVRKGDPFVATVGRIEVVPNTPNVIPSAVTFTLDIRHSDEKELSIFCNHLIAARILRGGGG